VGIHGTLSALSPSKKEHPLSSKKFKIHPHPFPLPERERG